MKERHVKAEDPSMDSNRRTTRSWFRFQFSLASLVFMSVMVGVLLFLNFRQNDNWYVAFAYTKEARGYGWPFLVSTWLIDFPEWSWLGLVCNIVFGGAAAFLLSVLFEMICRWRRKELPGLRLHLSAREWLAVAACVGVVLVLNSWPRTVSEATPGDYINVRTIRGWPCEWYAVSITSYRAGNATVPNLPVRTAFEGGYFMWKNLVRDLFLGAVVCGLFVRSLIWLRRRHPSAPSGNPQP
jgi:hypothetical protein